MKLHLALAFGVPPRHLGRVLTAREFAEYVALLNVDPWGPARADFQAATAAYGAAAVWSSDVCLSDFIPPWGEVPDAELTPAERVERWRARMKARKGR